jgi:hypothetical protein
MGRQIYAWNGQARLELMRSDLRPYVVTDKGFEMLQSFVVTMFSTKGEQEASLSFCEQQRGCVGAAIMIQLLFNHGQGFHAGRLSGKVLAPST